MTRITDATRKKVVQQHIQDGRTLKSLAAEYGVSKASISNWVRAYRKECQTNDEERIKLELMEELHKLRLEKADLEKENDFLKKSGGILCEGNRLEAYRFIDENKSTYGLRWFLRHKNIQPNAYFNY